MWFWGPALCLYLGGQKGMWQEMPVTSSHVRCRIKSCMTYWRRGGSPAAKQVRVVDTGHGKAFAARSPATRSPMQTTLGAVTRGPLPLNAFSCTRRLTAPPCNACYLAGTPADLLLSMLSNMLLGLTPDLRDVELARTMLLRHADPYQPLNLDTQMREANLDVSGAAGRAASGAAAWRWSLALNSAY